MTRDEMREYQRRWRMAHLDQERERDRRYRELNREKVNARSRERMRKKRAENPKYNSELCSKWRNSHIDQAREIDRKKRQRLQAERPWIIAARSCVGTALRRSSFGKKSKTAAVLGCEWETFKAWIEAQFQEGMSWENHGEWHLDHIVPMNLAESEFDAYAFCHHTNLQPLWKLQNRLKSDSTNHLSCRWPRP